MKLGINENNAIEEFLYDGVLCFVEGLGDIFQFNFGLLVHRSLRI